MTKTDLISRILNHDSRGEDALWLAEKYELDVPHHDEELTEATRLLLEGAERYYNRLSELDEELELHILGN